MHLHFSMWSVTSKDVFLVVKAILSDIYAKTVQIFPGGMKMHFVLDINTLPNLVTQGKIMHLCSKQPAFFSLVKEMTSHKIVSFDCSFVDKNSKEGTMQDRLMWLLSTKNEELTQFINVS